jgi:hypothetical protein
VHQQRGADADRVAGYRRHDRLGAAASAIMNLYTERSSIAPLTGRFFMKSSRSLPAVKISACRDQDGAHIGVAFGAFSASAMLWYIAAVIAFLRSGRLNSSVRMPSLMLLKISMSVSKKGRRLNLSALFYRV